MEATLARDAAMSGFMRVITIAEMAYFSRSSALPACGASRVESAARAHDCGCTLLLPMPACTVRRCLHARHRPRSSEHSGCPSKQADASTCAARRQCKPASAAAAAWQRTEHVAVLLARDVHEDVPVVVALQHVAVARRAALQAVHGLVAEHVGAVALQQGVSALQGHDADVHRDVALGRHARRRALRMGTLS
jgi:hypothetical protein